MGRAVFTYGTLMFPAVMRAVTGRDFPSASGRVSGFERQGVRGEVFPGVVAAPGASVDGVVWFDVVEETLLVLDRFEDWLYERQVVDVVMESDGRVVSAEAWVVPGRYVSALDGCAWDAGRFEAEEMGRYLEMCRGFRRAE